MFQAFGVIDQDIDRLTDQVAGGFQGRGDGVSWIYGQLVGQLLDCQLTVLGFGQTREGFARLTQRLGQALSGAVRGVDEQAGVGQFEVLDERGYHRLIPRPVPGSAPARGREGFRLPGKKLRRRPGPALPARR